MPAQKITIQKCFFWNRLQGKTPKTDDGQTQETLAFVTYEKSEPRHKSHKDRLTMRFSSRPLALWISTAAASCSVFARSSSAFIPTKRSAFVSATIAQQRRNFSSSSLNMARVALCQFPVSEDKDENHKTASDYLHRAAEKGAKLAVLPEIWNGPYATSAFEEYSEVLPDVGSTSADDSPSTQLLMKHAKETGMWVVGGSIPESDDGKIYNTCLVIDPSGKVVARHRKVHLFDIDVPGGITFFESDTLSPGETMTAFDGGDDFGMIGVGIWCVCIRPQRIERLIL